MKPSYFARGDRLRATLAVGLLTLAAVLAYAPALRAGFIWDDDSFLTKNRLIQSSWGLERIWFSTQPADYWPVTSTIVWVEWRLWGMHAWGYHAVNLALHMGEALILWRILRRLGVGGAYLAALFFALQPVNVESVAWIAETKNVVAMGFFLLSVWFFAREDPPRGRDWAISFASFVLGMLSKGSVAVLPLVLLGLIAWRRKVARRDWATLAPYFAVAAILVAVDIWFQGHHLRGLIRNLDWPDRIVGAGAVVWFYLGKALVPLKLVFVYPEWKLEAARWVSWLPLAAGAAVSLYFWRASRAAFFAWGYFIACLIPVMGFTDVYFMRYAPVADHYEHLAIIGVTAFAGWALSRLPKVGTGLGLGVALCVLAPLTWSQCHIYRNTETLFLATLKGNPNCWMARNNLGTLYQQEGQTARAVTEYRRALEIDPELAEVHYNLANSLAGAGQVTEAMSEYNIALRLMPVFPEAHYCLGLVLAQQGALPEAISEYEAALGIRANFPEAENSLATALVASGRPDEAVPHYRKALALNPRLPEARNDWGVYLLGAEKYEEAAEEFRVAIEVKPEYAQAHYNLGVALHHLGKLDEAIQEYEKAISLQPDYPEARENLELALRSAGRTAE